jgi:phosphoribosylformylglycinamidine cyclo-ligase
MTMKYKDSGVDIDRAKRAKDAIARHVASTRTPQVLSETGAFGGLYSLGGRYEDPVLVSSIDGVGTKLIVARMMGRFDTVGQDLVNHCVNDILVQGASPLFFLDYVASGTLDPDVSVAIVEGVATACREHGCALIGGETAEMPDVYQRDELDLAGCIVGVVDRKDIVDGSTIVPGDRVLGLPSNGLHTNGYSLVRRIFFNELGLDVNDHVGELGCRVGDELLKIHVSYLGMFKRIRRVVAVKGMAHITGGGIPDNLSRILPAGCDARIRMGSWPDLKIFEFLQHKGNVAEAEMYQVFNMGLGMLLVVGAGDEEKILSDIGGETPIYSVGEIVAGTGHVKLIDS